MTSSPPRPTVSFLLVVALAASVLVGLLAGAADIGLGDLVHVFRWRLGFVEGPGRLSDSVLWAIRIPRVLSGVVVGACLGVAGAGLQGAFRNQMADPQLVGISAGAGLGALAGIAVTPANGPPIFVILAAGVGGIVAGLLIRTLGARVPSGGQFILVGLALGLVLLAWLGAVVLAWDSPRVPTFTFWIFGGLSGARWSFLVSALPVVAAGAAGIIMLARSLDLIALGDREARSLGVDVDRVTGLLLISVGLVVGAAVALGGVIGFVGLVVPFILRRIVGPAHGRLLPLSAVGGAVLVVLVDTAARTIAAPVEIPVGLLTAIIGGPVFIGALLRAGRSAS